MAKVLLVDDDLSFLSAACRLLDVLHHEVLFASDPVKALELVKNESPDVVITDSALSPMSGPELIMRIKQISPGTACILMSATMEERSDLLPFVPILQKPFSEGELLSAVEKVLANWKAVINVASGYLHVVFRGRFSMEKAKKSFLEVLDAVAATGMTNVLIDARQVTGVLTSLDRYSYGEFVAEKVFDSVRRGTVSRSPKFAYIFSPPILSSDRTGENTAVNRGMNVKVFDNREDALKWLGVTQN